LEKPVYRKQRNNSYLENSLEERAIQLARYMVENNATVRQTATVFGISKSTVHKDLTERLPSISHPLAEQARQVLDVNKAERHIRGGMATRDKYLSRHRQEEASGWH